MLSMGWFTNSIPPSRRDRLGKKLLPVAVLTGLACFGLAAGAFGAVIHVPADRKTIQFGLAAAAGGDTVLVAPGTYYEHDLQMKAGVCLRGETGQAADVIVNAQQAGRVLYCQGVGADTRIEGLTLTGGALTTYGGGIYCSSASPMITGCVVTGNFAEAGGSGVYCVHSNPVITDCSIWGNLQSVDGGALYLSSSSPILTRCLLAGNRAQIWGGAMYAAESSPVLSHCTVAGNQSISGGGIWICYSTHVTLEDTIVASSTNGEGIYVYEDASHSSDVALSCCDVFGNQDGNYGGDIQDQTGLHGNISLPPAFCDPALGNYHLTEGSVCLPENNSCQILIGAFGQGCSAPAAAPADSRTDAALSWSVPNPLRSGWTIALRLPTGGAVSLALHDATGRLVRHLVTGTVCPAGEQRFRWDGKSDDGRSLPSGMYFWHLQAGTRMEVKKTLLLE
jgi:hypothetical protein